MADTMLSNLKLLSQKAKTYVDTLSATVQAEINTILASSYYENATVNASTYTTMGALKSFIDSKNSEGKHFLFDFTGCGINNAYVCTVSMWTANNINYCSIFDIINKKIYMDYSGYSSTTTISSYLSQNSNDITHTVPLTNPAITLGDIKVLLDEVNSLGDHIFFDTFALSQSGFYLTTISYHKQNATMSLFDMVGAKFAVVNYKADMTLIEAMSQSDVVITTYNADVLTDLVAKVAYRTSVLEGSSETADWDTIQANVVQGRGKEKYPTYNPDTKTGSGTQIVVDWTRKDSSAATETTYNMPFNVVYHSDKNSANPIGILDGDWSVDSYYNSNSAGTLIGSENTHNNYMMYLESQYTLPFGTQFDASEAMATISANGMPAGTYYFKCSGVSVGGDTSITTTYCSFTTTEDLVENMQIRPNITYTWDRKITNPTTLYVYTNNATSSAYKTFTITCTNTEPAEGQYIGSLANANGSWPADTPAVAKVYFKTPADFNSKDDSIRSGHYLNHVWSITYGYNRWSQSALRQWLNSEGFNWWKAMNVWDRPPSYVNYRGYLSGLSETLRNCIKPVRRWVRMNTITDTGIYEYTYDKVFIHTPSEMYAASDAKLMDGCRAQWPWYKNLLDTWNADKGTSLTQFNNYATYDILKRYRIDAQTSSQHYWSSAPYRGYSYTVWFVNSSGTVLDYLAYYGYCCLPAFVISL